MGGSSNVDFGILENGDLCSDCPRNLVLVGSTGKGKSATGNSIMGKQVFESKMSYGGVTSRCQLHGPVLIHDHLLNVIDTPGFFDCSDETELISKEIANCITMVRDGIHAVLLVVSGTSRFSNEEAAAVKTARAFFGDKITDYMIIVFTGGDTLCRKTLEDNLGDKKCPEPLKEIVSLCEHRIVLFDNVTSDQTKDQQVQELLFLVDVVVANNDGKPYINEFCEELKVELKLKESISRLEKELYKERVDRKKAEERSENAQKENAEFQDKVKQLEGELFALKREKEKNNEKGPCVIL